MPVATFEIDPVGAGAVVTNTDVHVEELRGNTDLRDALNDGISAADTASEVVTALQGVLDNIATPAQENILGLCESRLVAASEVINAYLMASDEMRERGEISQEAVGSANDNLDWDQYGSVDLNEL